MFQWMVKYSMCTPQLIVLGPCHYKSILKIPITIQKYLSDTREIGVPKICQLQ